MPAAISCAAPSPCTFTGQRQTGIFGKRRPMICITSWMAAPVPDVTTPTQRGRNGMGFLCAGSKYPLPLELLPERQKPRVQRARALPFERLHIELEAPVARIQRGVALRAHLHAVLPGESPAAAPAP